MTFTRKQRENDVRSTNISSVIAFATLCAGCGAVDQVADPEAASGARQEALSNKDFDVDFSDCSEFAGIGFVPASSALAYVPAGYTLAVNSNDALVVVRVARCAGAIVDGKPVGPTITSQVGITLQGPDDSADINNYTVFYATNQARLHARFQAAGVTADNSNDLELSLDAGALVAQSASPHSAGYQVSGTASVPSSPATTFAASWWANGVHGVVQSRTGFPQIRFGVASTTLVTTPGSPLASLLGGSALTFPVLDSYNTFSSAHLEVRRGDWAATLTPADSVGRAARHRVNAGPASRPRLYCLTLQLPRSYRGGS